MLTAKCCLLLLRHRQFVIANSGRVNLVSQLELGVNSQVGILGFDVLVDEELQRHPGHLDSVNGHGANMHFAFTSDTHSVSLDTYIVCPIEYRKQRVGGMLPLLDFVEINHRKSSHYA